jgi:hypothetical protein
MAKQVKCSFCGKTKWMENKYFKLNLSIFKAENHEQLNNKYLCKYCRYIKQPNKLIITPEFKRFQNILQEAINEYIRSGWNNREAEMLCRSNVEAILADQHIKPTQYKVIRNEHRIKGILINDIPFWHNVLVEIEWKDNKHEVL